MPLSFQAFRAAFQGTLRLEDARLSGAHLRTLGGAEGVGLDLLRASPDNDLLESAALQFAYAEGDTEFDQFSLKCIGIFLSVVLESSAVADEWMLLAMRQLKAKDVSSCTTTHAGFTLRLLQMKPYAMFLLTVTDDLANERRSEVE